MTLRTLLIDAGGTLFPEAMHDVQTRVDAVQHAMPALAPDDVRRLVLALNASTATALQGGVQHSDVMIARVLDDFSRGLGRQAGAVRAAMVDSMFGATQPYAGAAEMLNLASDLGLACVLLGDTSWHSEADYWTRLREMGLAEHLTDIVSSFEIGARKPNRIVFDLALARSSSAPRDCVMVGDSETNDIVPAHVLGMQTIRVGVQYPITTTTCADATAENLDEVADTLRRWCRRGN
jgi:FMN phosphatase YigB (HAD superfamily)